jgi:hypothetical protein
MCKNGTKAQRRNGTKAQWLNGAKAGERWGDGEMGRKGAILKNLKTEEIDFLIRNS